VIAALATCEWVRKGQPLCLIGDSGTGKSHLLIALGTAAAMAGFRVRYTLASKLANELAEAADDRQLTKTINRYGRVGLLCLFAGTCVRRQLKSHMSGRAVPGSAHGGTGCGSDPWRDFRSWRRSGRGALAGRISYPVQ
jgi:hypothetical protein